LLKPEYNDNIHILTSSSQTSTTVFGNSGPK
jgi:hypothetical protein